MHQIGVGVMAAESGSGVRWHGEGGRAKLALEIASHKAP